MKTEKASLISLTLGTAFILSMDLQQRKDRAACGSSPSSGLISCSSFSRA